MPVATYCLKHGLSEGAGRCPECKRERNRERNSRPGHNVWNSAPWKRVRKLALERDGYRCRYLEAGHRCAATARLSVHHIQALAEGGAMFELGNLVTLCDRHHGSIDRRRAVANAKRMA
jgi:hypothetical protein